MKKDRIRLLILFAEASMFADVIRRELDGVDYEIVTLDDLSLFERQRDPIFYLQSLGDMDMRDYYIHDTDPVDENFTQRGKYKMPNADRQYLKKWQPKI